ncbi:MAG: phospho-sugar mutase [Ilumatobacteraceae bacterium]
MTPAEALATAQTWLEAEPDEDVRAELRALLAAPTDELVDRFSGRLTFGTAGLRAPVGAGPRRMNRLVVRQAAAGLAAYVRDAEPDSAARGIVIGYDARRKSDVFALDTARVVAAAGLRVRVLPTALPTPVLAWTLLELGAAAGVMVTASHNPPADNGYKVYLGDGAQIVSPRDVEIATQIASVEPTRVELAATDDPLIEVLDPSIVDRYVAAAAAVRLRSDVPGVAVAYTPMHGVAGAIALRAFAAAGLPGPAVVGAQAEPDAAFPTVAFPNPEEPGAMDLVVELAVERRAALALANDPDGDRLGAAVPQADGSWRRLGGDEIGWLLAEHILRHTTGDDRLVVTTLVSSSLLGRMAADHGVHFAETYTGFKWMGRAILERPELRCVFAYEQALGYLVAPPPAGPLDKDGISAAVLLAEIAAVAEENGTTVQGRLDEIAARYGRYVIAERSVEMASHDAAEVLLALQQAPPTDLAGLAVEDVVWFEEATLLRLVLHGGTRLQLRPSGTEPKLKLYAESIATDPTPALQALEDTVLKRFQ